MSTSQPPFTYGRTVTLIAVTPFSDGCVERFVLNVEDPRPAGRSELNRSDEFWATSAPIKVVDLLPCVIPANAAYCRRTNTRSET